MTIPIELAPVGDTLPRENANTTNKLRHVTRRWKILAAAAAIGCLLFVLILESLVRLVGLDVPMVWEPDAILGWHHIPGAKRHFTEEGDGWIEVNHLGYRDRKRSLEKPSGTFRIMALGDSMTEAVQVNREQTYSALLEQRLTTEHRPVEVLNCGVNGYSPLQELLLLRQEGPRYHPDLVMVGIFLDNDVSGCHSSLSTVAGQSPFAEIAEAGLAFDYSRAEESYESYHRQPIHFIRKWSATYRWFRAASQSRAAAAGPSPGVPTRYKLYADPCPPTWEDAWAVFQQCLLELSAETKRQGAQLVIVSLPCAQTVVSQSWENVQQRHPAMQGKSWDLERPERRLSEFAEKHGITLLTLLPLFRSKVDGGPLYFGDVGHMTPRGHQIAADAIGDFLCDRKLVPDPAKKMRDQTEPVHLGNGTNSPTPRSALNDELSAHFADPTK